MNPLKDVEELGETMGFTMEKQNFHNVSLGQGQEIVAENAIEIAAKMGHWVVLQNIHLVKKWLPSLEKNLERYAEGSHLNYRIFMSAEPAATPTAHIIPQVNKLNSYISLRKYRLHFTVKLKVLICYKHGKSTFIIVILFIFYYRFICYLVF